MDELTTQLTQRLGITPDQARQAIETVLGFVKGRLPAPIANQLDGLLGTTASGTGHVPAPTGELGSIATELGGLFNR